MLSNRDMRRVALTSVVYGISSLASIPGAKATALGTLTGGTQSAAAAINSYGQVVGVSDVTGGAQHAFLWTPTAANGSSGSMVDLGTLGGTNSFATAINSGGSIVGYAQTAAGSYHAFLWTPTAANGSTKSSMVDLGTLNGLDSYAYGINDSGTIVGESETASEDDHAVSWASGATSPTDLGLITATQGSGLYSAAFSINKAGQIVGEGDTFAGATHAILIPSSGSAVQDLGVLQFSSTIQGTYSSAACINNNGEVVGQADDASGNPTAFYWVTSQPVRQNGAMYKIYGTAAYSINNISMPVGMDYSSDAYTGAGFYVYHSEDYGPNSGRPQPFVADITAVKQATGINDSDQIVGFSIVAGKRQAVLTSTTSGEGSQPIGSLIKATDGNFYGTASADGANGGGTVFKLTTSGAVTPIHHFSLTDGHPTAGVVQVGSYLYGTTEAGIIYKVSLDGTTYAVLNDQYGGSAGLIYGSDGNFYGATDTVGTIVSYPVGSNTSVIFKMDTSGNVTVLHTFSGTDGSQPNTLLEGSDGLLYGTTFGGGVNSAGTVFKITKAGAFTSLYSFTLASSGIWGPESGLIQSGSFFYGTASQGGSSPNGLPFKIDTSGNFTAIQTSATNTYGQYWGPLLLGSDGYLYGTTEEDGSSDPEGCVFKISTTGIAQASFPYNFQYSPNDGGYSFSGLVQSNSTLFYGTTYGGGMNPGNSSNFGLGTIYTISNTGTETVIHKFAG